MSCPGYRARRVDPDMRPGELFAQLWGQVEPCAGPILEGPWDGRGAPEFQTIVDLLLVAPSEDVPPEVDAYLAGAPAPFACTASSSDERAFIVMCALDQVAMEIHPAVATRVGVLAGTISPMLRAMKTLRTSDGCYADVPGVGMVIPKGHLMSGRRPNDRQDASGTDIVHQFDYLTLVKPLAHPRRLRMLVPAPHRCEIPPARAGQVGLAPIAEDRDDLCFHASSRGKGAARRAYVDTRPAAPLLADRMGLAVSAMLDGGAGLVVLPELVTTVDAVDALQVMLRARPPGATPALILAGTGPSRDAAPSGRPFNETQVLNASGRLLFGQRKINLFNMAAERMAECSIDPAQDCGGNPHMEDAAAGEEIVVCDLHGLGRIMVMICEDLEQAKPGGDVALAVRPDWILNPVLDVSQTVGRWPHARAIEIGRKTGSRVIVSCSATLSVRKARKASLAEVSAGSIQTGVCYDGHEEGRVLFVEANGASVPDFAIVSWDSQSWQRHRTIMPQ